MTDATPGRLARLIDRFGPFLGLAAVAGLFAALAPSRFLSLYNAETILTQSVIVGIGALGMTFVIRSGGIDLSVGSAIAFASVVTALALDATELALVGALAGIAAGAAIGALNGGLIAGLALPPFIVTLGTLGAARGAAKWLANEQTVDAPDSWLSQAMSKNPDGWLGIAPGVWLMLFSSLLAAFVLRRTVFGVWTTSIGSNERAAVLCGIPVKRTKVWIYVLMGAAAGIGGVLQFGRLTVGDPTTAMGKELDVIAAVVIGGASLSGGSGTILGTLVGALLMATLANGCNLVGVPNYVQEILIGAIIVTAVALDRLRS